MSNLAPGRRILGIGLQHIQLHRVTFLTETYLRILGIGMQRFQLHRVGLVFDGNLFAYSWDWNATDPIASCGY